MKTIRKPLEIVRQEGLLYEEHIWKYNKNVLSVYINYFPLYSNYSQTATKSKNNNQCPLVPVQILINVPVTHFLYGTFINDDEKDSPQGKYSFPLLSSCIEKSQIDVRKKVFYYNKAVNYYFTFFKSQFLVQTIGVTSVILPSAHEAKEIYEKSTAEKREIYEIVPLWPIVFNLASVHSGETRVVKVLTEPNSKEKSQRDDKTKVKLTRFYEKAEQISDELDRISFVLDKFLIEKSEIKDSFYPIP